MILTACKSASVRTATNSTLRRLATHGKEIRQVLQEIQGREGVQEVSETQAASPSHAVRADMTRSGGETMKIAVVSDDFRTLTGRAGRARRFLLFEAEEGRPPQLETHVELPAQCPTYHELHDDDQTPHPLDGMVLIANEAGEGFRERLARRGTQVHITSERDPCTAVALFLEGKLPGKAPTPRQESDCQPDKPLTA